MLYSGSAALQAKNYGLNPNSGDEFNFDLSRPTKVKCHGGIRLPIYDFLLVFNSNIWPNSAAL